MRSSYAPKTKYSDTIGLGAVGCHTQDTSPPLSKIGPSQIPLLLVCISSDLPEIMQSGWNWYPKSKTKLTMGIVVSMFAFNRLSGVPERRPQIQTPRNRY